MVLQYRVVVQLIHHLPTSSLYNAATQQVGTTGQNIQRIKVLLPAECDNQDVVQIRWISNNYGWLTTIFAIDNITVIDVVPPVNADGFPKISSILSDGFDFLTKINEAGKLIL
jgi:hypothetical protein